jgi:hypothetical protein
VQSTAIALLVLQGKLPRPDLFIFADTRDEPRKVNEHLLAWQERLRGEGFELAVVAKSKAGLQADYLAGCARGENPPQPPLWIVDPASPGRRMPMRRQCTERYKIRPIKALLRKRYGVVHDGTVQVEQWMGISVDEAHRMKPAHARWYRMRWPLIDLGMRRTDCLQLLKAAGESAPRSACRYCPFHSDREWARLKEDADEWAKIVEFERQIEAVWKANGGTISGQDSCPTLHRSGRPIGEIDFDLQGEMFGGWGNECAGVCGV